jgi:uncharacterized membrane protein HdeD (DUF308 family)
MSTTAVREAARSMGPWWLFLITGIVWLVFAFFVLSFDLTTVWAIAVFAGAMFIAGGMMQFLIASQVDSWKWLHVVLGIVAIIAGLMAFVWPGQTFLVLAAIIAWYLLFDGIFNIVLAIMTREVYDLWWLTLLLGIAEIFIGFWAISYENPGRSVVLLVVWVAATAIARGIGDIFLAFRVKKLQG